MILQPIIEEKYFFEYSALTLEWRAMNESIFCSYSRRAPPKRATLILMSMLQSVEYSLKNTKETEKMRTAMCFYLLLELSGSPDLETHD